MRDQYLKTVNVAVVAAAHIVWLKVVMLITLLTSERSFLWSEQFMTFRVLTQVQLRNTFFTRIGADSTERRGDCVFLWLSSRAK